MESKHVDSIIQSAVMKAEGLQHEYMTVEHLTVCLLESNKIKKVLADLQVDGERI